MANDLTPVMQQYMSLKEKAKDCVLLFRLGDFYELFYEDALECAPILQIALTTRDGEIPMCGIPYHYIETYLPRLLNAKKKIAIAEQMEEPGKSAIVRREIVQILTPGLSIEGEEERILASIFFNEGLYFLSYLNLGGRKLKLIKFENIEELEDFLSNEPVKEVLVPEGFNLDNRVFQSIYTTLLDESYYNFKISEEEILKTFGISSIKGLGIDEEGFVFSLGALLKNIKETIKNPISSFGEIDIRIQGREVVPPSTLRNLEIFKTMEGEKEGSFFQFFDKTTTPMGKRKLKEFLSHPLKDKKEILKRQGVVSYFFSNFELVYKIQKILKGTPDITKILGKLELGREHPRELLSLSLSLNKLNALRNLKKGDEPELLQDIQNPLFEIPEKVLKIKDILKEEIPFLYKEGNFIKEGVSEELDNLRNIKKNSSKIIFEMEKEEREKHNIPTLKIKYNKVFGYFIEISKGQLGKVPENYIRKQTLTNAERFYTKEIKILEEKIFSAEEKIVNLELEIYENLRKELKEEISVLLKISENIGLLDSFLSMAIVAKEEGFTLPKITEDRSLKIIESWHPVVAKLVSFPFVYNDCIMDGKREQIMIITGPNMGGKSTYLRQIGLVCLLAQIGSFVPAKEATLCIFDHIFTRVGSADFLYRGESTFMVEMIEMSRILRGITNESLVLLDEVGRGTSTFDGLSIAWATVEYLHNEEGKKGLCLFATHYHELTNLKEELERVVNKTFAVKEYKDKIIFLHRLIDGGASRSYGIEVAKLAGIPEKTIERAKEILKILEESDLLKDKKILKERVKQLKLFDLYHPVLEEIKSIDVDNLTPIQALNLIEKWKKEI